MISLLVLFSRASPHKRGGKILKLAEKLNEKGGNEGEGGLETWPRKKLWRVKSEPTAPFLRPLTQYWPKESVTSKFQWWHKKVKVKTKQSKLRNQPKAASFNIDQKVMSLLISNDDTQMRKWKLKCESGNENIDPKRMSPLIFNLKIVQVKNGSGKWKWKVKVKSETEVPANSPL